MVRQGWSTDPTVIRSILTLALFLAAGCGDNRSPSAHPHPDDSITALRQRMADPRWQVRARAITEVGELRERRLIPELVRALNDPMVAVRERASRVLQWMGDDSSLPPLRAAVRHESDPAVRGNVAEALARIGGRKELPLLGTVLTSDPDEGVRARTAAALGAAQIREAVPLLIAALADPGVSVRARAAEALGDSRDPLARAALERTARSDSDAGVRATAASALARLRER